MATLKELVAEHSLRNVKLAGMDLPARMVDIGVQRLVEELRPSPEPPMVQDPTKGSAAPKIEDRENPVYQMRHSVWTDQYLAIMLGLAIVHGGGAALLGISREQIPPMPETEQDLANWNGLLAEIEALLCTSGLSVTEVRMATIALREPPDPEKIRKKSSGGGQS